MSKYNTIPIEKLRQVLACNSETGKLTWKHRPISMFAASGKHSQEHKANAWNARFAGKEALTGLDRKGYLRGRVLGVNLFAHRVVWALTYGVWPTADIDHEDGIPGFNKPSRMREASVKENAKNQKIRSDNTSGICGVNWFQKASKWRAGIVVDGKHVHLGLYSRKSAARTARKNAEIKYGFHPNHGRSGKHQPT